MGLFCLYRLKYFNKYKIEIILKSKGGFYYG